MPLPAWMHGHPGAPKPLPNWISERLTPETDDNKPVGITACTCRGEGCGACDGDGVIYP